MPVFISHRKTDSTVVRRIHLILVENDIKCYIDELDDELKNAEGITKIIMASRINDCTPLLAVISYNTQNSWWGPFEIGVCF